MTYQVGWDEFIWPAIKRRRQAAGQPVDEDEDKNPGYEPYKRAGYTRDGKFLKRKISSDMSVTEAKNFLTHICGNRVYTGPRFWEPGCPGITIYDGKDN